MAGDPHRPCVAQVQSEPVPVSHLPGQAGNLWLTGRMDTCYVVPEAGGAERPAMRLLRGSEHPR